eukprot:NODE_367_length_8687_cov_0.577084.p4 type:complete len:197 gc:universal NODE_367_length_8687_cov_0.577084:3473-4063(+)
MTLNTSAPIQIDYIEDVKLDKSDILGGGGYGTVYLGEWQNRKIAIKVIRDVAFCNPHSTRVTSDALALSKSVLREVKALGTLTDFSNICKYYGVTCVEGQLGLVMEFIDNCSLHVWLHKLPNGKSLTNLQKDQIQIGIANGLKYMHSNGIAHNDLKPANIMLDSQFNPKLIDFGMVKIQKWRLGGVHGLALTLKVK